MKVNRVAVIVVAACTAALAQDGVIMTSNALLQNGVSLNFTTRLEPRKPPLVGGFTGGNVTDREGMHRYLASNALHRFFGYDLQVAAGPEKGSYRVMVSPLSITPAQIKLEAPESWMTIALPGYPTPQTVHDGDTVAIEMFASAATGQKITDYIYFPKPGNRSLTTYVLAREDVVYVNVPELDGSSGTFIVRPDGFINIRTAGELKAEGRTPKQLGDAIAAALTRSHHRPITAEVQLVRPARKAPELILTLQDGKTLSLSSLHGKTVALAFVFTNCAHCQGLCAILAGIQKDYAAKGVVFVGAAVNDSAKNDLAAYIQSYSKGAFPVGWSTQSAAREFLQHTSGAFYAPTMVFIDRNGMIQSQHLGSEDFFKDQDRNIRAELDRLLR